jgi:recombinational DNA repair protein RecR
MRKTTCPACELEHLDSGNGCPICTRPRLRKRAMLVIEEKSETV